MKNNIKQFVKEIIPIIVGMLIALFINNWNEDRKDKKYINQIFSSIKKEFKETNEDIIDNISKQKTLIDTLDIYLNNDKVSILDIMIKGNGIHLPTIRIYSWKAISNSRIELINYDKLSSLVNIEEAKENFKMKTEKLADFLYSNLNEKSKEKKGLVKILMSDIIATETSIKEEIKKIIKDK